ncbi:MAG: J domain-containing protein [Caldilineaceae bacterium]|nr:J domain-containing protein [Caldilineaceae bacterium]
MPVIDALVDDPLFFTVPLQERMTRRGEDSTDCFAILELEPPCSVDDVKRAYRQLAKRLHPDQGGDQVQFLALQVAYKEALRLVGVTSP